MPATITTRAKAALRARKSNAKSRTAATARDGNDAAESTFERHSRKCKICNHPDREAIEELFVNWHTPQSIRGQFAIYNPFDWTAIYRHARAAGLYAKRRKNLRAVLEHLLEGVTNVPPTAHGVIAAVRAFTCLTDSHQWVEPERRVRIVNEVYRHDVPAPAPPSAPVASANPAPEPSTELPAVSPAQDTPHKNAASASSTKSSSYACSSLSTGHCPLPSSNRQSSKLESPPTRT